MEKEAALLPPSMRSRLALPRPVFCHTRHASSGVFLFPCFTKEIGVWPRSFAGQVVASTVKQQIGRCCDQVLQINRLVVGHYTMRRPAIYPYFFDKDNEWAPRCSAMQRNYLKDPDAVDAFRWSALRAHRSVRHAGKGRRAPHDRQRRQRGARLPALLRARRMD